MAQHCSQQGMQFLMAVRGCQADDPTYTAVTNINWQQFCMTQQNNATAAGGMMGMNGTTGLGGVGLPGTVAPVNGGRTAPTSGSGSSRVGAAVAATVMAVAVAFGL
jgi:hypothetical protein